MSSKQVLVMRKFPKGLRIGKYVAQGAHASMAALFSIGKLSPDDNSYIIPLHDLFVKEWVIGMFKKVTLQVEDEKELIDIYTAATAAGLPCSLIKDSGLTEFAGIPTLTAVGIGPADEIEINKITGHLKLF